MAEQNTNIMGGMEAAATLFDMGYLAFDYEWIQMASCTKQLAVGTKLYTADQINAAAAPLLAGIVELEAVLTTNGYPASGLCSAADIVDVVEIICKGLEHEQKVKECYKADLFAVEVERDQLRQQLKSAQAREAALRVAFNDRAQGIECQLDLIAHHATGGFLDKRPVVQSLQLHVRRIREALSIHAGQQQLANQKPKTVVQTFNESGTLIQISLQDANGNILEVLWEISAADANPAFSFVADLTEPSATASKKEST